MMETRRVERRAAPLCARASIGAATVALLAMAGACQLEPVPELEQADLDVDVAVSSQAQKVTPDPALIGQELSVPTRLSDGDEQTMSLKNLLDHGQQIFAANWTGQEGGGRPLTKGTGGPLSDMGSPLLFPRNFNRVSAPDANSCAGCHNAPFGVAGGGGDIVANVFVLGHRFDFATFDGNDALPTRGAVDENGDPVTLDDIANSRATLGMFGGGFVEMLARQITEDLQAIRDMIPPDGSAALVSKGISYGTLARAADGSWETGAVEGLTIGSLASSGPDDPPSLLIKPFHQASAVISLRQFTNNAMNHHHGIQTSERFGDGTDPDGDGFEDEMSRADVTAASLYQAALAVPGRVIPSHPEIEAAVAEGEALFAAVGCADCHKPSLPLTDEGWIFTEPNPFNPPGNLQVGDAPTVAMDLTDRRLPGPRLKAQGGVVEVPIFTDFKLHDITDGPTDPNIEPIDMHATPGTPEFTAGNSRFLTKRLWGAANEPPYFHHGKFTTMREAIEAHAGDAADQRAAYMALSDADQNAMIEFLKTLQVLPPGTKAQIVDEQGNPRSWKSSL